MAHTDRQRPVKYIFVTGGVVSSLGKGLAAASIGCLLEGHGYKVALQKFDPYINVDPGTMSPYQHGEVYVTDDGAETDLDLGHYERFTEMVATRNHNWTTGKIYLSVIQRERFDIDLGEHSRRWVGPIGVTGEPDRFGGRDADFGGARSPSCLRQRRLAEKRQTKETTQPETKQIFSAHEFHRSRSTH